MTQGDLDSIAKKGLINHIRDGGRVQYVQDLQKRWKKVAEHKSVTRLDNQTVMGPIQFSNS